MGNLDVLGRNSQRTMSRSPTGQSADLGVETECTSIESNGETMTLLFILSKNMYCVASTCPTPARCQGNTKAIQMGAKSIGRSLV